MARISEMIDGGKVATTDKLPVLRAGANVQVAVGGVALQEPGAIAFTGGTIDGVAVGETLRSTGKFITVDATGDISVNGNQFIGKVDGVSKMLLGAANSINEIISGSAIGDVALRSQGGSILLSVDSGSTVGLSLDNTGNVNVADGEFTTTLGGRGLKLTASVGNNSSIIDTTGETDLELRVAGWRKAHVTPNDFNIDTILQVLNSDVVFNKLIRNTAATSSLGTPSFEGSFRIAGTENDGLVLKGRGLVNDISLVNEGGVTVLGIRRNQKDIHIENGNLELHRLVSGDTGSIIVNTGGGGTFDTKHYVDAVLTSLIRSNPNSNIDFQSRVPTVQTMLSLSRAAATFNQGLVVNNGGVTTSSNLDSTGGDIRLLHTNGRIWHGQASGDGNSILSINARTNITTANTTVRFNRETNTTGGVAFQWLGGDGTSNVVMQHNGKSGELRMFKGDLIVDAGKISIGDAVGANLLEFKESGVIKGAINLDSGTSNLNLSGFNRFDIYGSTRLITGDLTVAAGQLSVNSGAVNTVASFVSTDSRAEISIQDNGTTGAGYVGIRATGNTLGLLSGGAEFITVSATGDMSLSAGKKLYLDGGGDTYIMQNGGNVMEFYTGGNLNLQITNADTKFLNTNLVVNSGDLTVKAGFLNLGAPQTNVISAGVLTPTTSNCRVDTEAAASTDDINTITAGKDGDTLILRCVSSGRTVVLKDGIDNLALAGDLSLTHAYDTISLIFDAALNRWLETSRSDNAA